MGGGAECSLKLRKRGEKRQDCAHFCAACAAACFGEASVFFGEGVIPLFLLSSSGIPMVSHTNAKASDSVNLCPHRYRTSLGF